MTRTLRVFTASSALLVLAFGWTAYAAPAHASGPSNLHAPALLGSWMPGERAALTPPALGHVPLVVRSTTGKKPPKNVKFVGEPMGMLVTGDATTSDGAPGESVITGVPGYSWRHGCGPTAVGMVVGYYDGQGWGDLIPGDATSQTSSVNQTIASDANSGAPGHLEDYSLPKETSATVLPDLSQPPSGDEHASNCVADFMHTSWSYDGLPYGWSYSNMVAPAFVNFVGSKYPAAAAFVSAYRGPDLTWTLLKQEVEAGRPMVFLVDSTGDAMTDHFVTVVGYRETDGYAEYGCWDTWNSGLLRWQRFRGLSSSYDWGVWGGFTFTLGAAPPEPTPTPTPSPTPTPATDLTPPTTTLTGGDDAWHQTTVTLTLSATDDVSGVAYTEYSINDGGWVQGTEVSLSPVRRKRAGNSGVHTVQYRSADAAGNVEETQYAVVKLDAVTPTTTHNADSATYAGSFDLVLTATDAHSGVAATYYAIDGKDYRLGTSARVTGKGAHKVQFYSVDAAGNVEPVKSVTVSIR